MGASTEQDLWMILEDGGDIRRIQDMDGRGQPGITLAKDIRERYDLDIGDAVGYNPVPEENKVEVIFPER